ncbi:hypothetical protein Fcan01_01286 [Folsomia candida]|uniref:Uncharacterized protein n=1 Tax=Folsomia candida TaxID=158441 RepID=A0A226EYC4_FOLCA|nr:hypothetical protein Fcan01_01286 [Folsomia candida]
MVKDKLVNCDNCAGVTDKNRVNFSSRIKNSDCTVNQAIQLFFPSVLTTTPSRPKKDLRYLCQKCSLQLGTAYIKLQEFKERTKDNTYIGRKLVISVQHLPQQYEEPCTSASALDSHSSENAEYCISENNDLERASLLQEEESEVESENEARHPAGRSEGALQRKSTPIGQKLKNVFSRTNQKSFKSLRSNINRIINAELAVLGDNSSFGSQNSGDLFPSLDVIYEECENFAPVTLSILGALVGLGEGLFTPAMRSIVGIALYQRRMHDNIFAKSVGALLWKNGVSVNTYTLFHEMGISVCYKTILNYMETQQKTFDKPVRDWKKEIEDELVSSQNPRSRNARPMFQPEEATSSLSCLRIYESSDDEINVTPGITSTPARSLSLKRGSLARKKLNFSDVSTQEESFKSFCLSYDNLNKSIHPRHYGNTNTLHSLNVVVFIAIRDRIATPWRMVLSPRPILDLIDIPMSAFVLQESEVTTMKQLHLREIILILQENQAIVGTEIMKTLLSNQRVWETKGSLNDLKLKYCFCLKPYDAKDKTTEWICCDNYDCSENQWYHQACIKKYTAKRGNMKWKKITKDSFTEAFSHSSGKLTEKMIRIRGSSGGNLAEIEKRAAKELMGEEFTPVVGKAHRVHSGFENFNNDFMYIGNYFEYEKAMKNLSKNLSKISRIQNRKYAIDMNVGVNVLEQDNFSSYTSIA